MQPTPMGRLPDREVFFFASLPSLFVFLREPFTSPEEKSYSLCLIMALRWNSRLSQAGQKCHFSEKPAGKRGDANSTRQFERVTGTVAKEPTRRDFSTSKAAQATHWTVGRGCGKVGPGQVDTSLFLREPYAPQTHIKQDSPRSRQVSRHRSPSDSLPRNARRRPALPPTCVPSRASVRTLV